MTAEPKKKTSGTKKSAIEKPRAPRVRKVSVKTVKAPVETVTEAVAVQVPVELVAAPQDDSAMSPARVPAEGGSPQGRYSYAIGRRKTSVARVRLYHSGTGVITVNGKDYRTYFPVRTWQDEVLSPLTVSGTNDKMDISVVVLGGGIHSQAGAVRHGISRALLDFDATFRKTLKKVGYLTRDPRAKERKKPGLRRARRAPQWAKR